MFPGIAYGSRLKNRGQKPSPYAFPSLPAFIHIPLTSTMTNAGNRSLAGKHQLQDPEIIIICLLKILFFQLLPLQRQDFRPLGPLSVLNPEFTGQKKAFCCAATCSHAGLIREDRSASGAAAPDRTGSARHYTSEESYNYESE